MSCLTVKLIQHNQVIPPSIQSIGACDVVKFVDSGSTYQSWGCAKTGVLIVKKANNKLIKKRRHGVKGDS